MAEKPLPAGADAETAPTAIVDAPPWGDYVDPDLAYIRGQIGSVGSGALGGRSCSDLGGFVEQDARASAEILAEVRRILRARSQQEH